MARSVFRATTKFGKQVQRPTSRSGSNGVARIVRDGYGPQWYDTVNEVAKRDDTCQICGKSILAGQKWETHHLKRLSRGGTTSKSNLARVHSECHDTRHPHLTKKNR